MLNEDYRDILLSLSNNKVAYLVVGAYALGIHGYPRATGDIDIWVAATPENSSLVHKALAEFGAPLGEITASTFAEKGIVFQIGVAPRRIDILTQIDGVEFSDAWPAREIVDLDGLAIPFISKPDLIRNKLATGRKKDLLDAEMLQE